MTTGANNGSHPASPMPYQTRAMPEGTEILSYCWPGMSKREVMAMHIAAGMAGQVVPVDAGAQTQLVHAAIQMTDKLLDALGPGPVMPTGVAP